MKKIKSEQGENGKMTSAAKPGAQPVKLTPAEIIEMERRVWIRSTPADLYYDRDKVNPEVMVATEKSKNMHVAFEETLIGSGMEARSKFPVREPPKHCPVKSCSDSDDSDDEQLEQSLYRVSF